MSHRVSAPSAASQRPTVPTKFMRKKCPENQEWDDTHGGHGDRVGSADREQLRTGDIDVVENARARTLHST
jgi:hypothetical protein